MACETCGATPGFEECSPVTHSAKAECRRIVAILRNDAGLWDADGHVKYAAMLRRLADALERGDL